ncbi:MAG TPA: ECF transporter S component [Caldilineaceae bacterium]|nr:ECF transporter S component [Caldilineaceae bacterium]
MSFGERLRRDFSTLTIALIPVAIAINLVIGQIVLALKLPVYLDSIGTVLVAILAGPWAGALAGALTNIVWGIWDPGSFPWFPVNLLIGLTAGICANYGWFKVWWGVLLTGILISIVAAIASAFINVALFGGITASGSSFLTAYLLQSGQQLLSAVLTTNFIVEPIDKIATSFLAWAIVKGLSARYVARFPRASNVLTTTPATPGARL